MVRNNKYAEVYVDIKAFDIDHACDYRIPPHLSSDINTGRIVEVPFKNRTEIGYIVKIKDKSGLEDNEIKDIVRVIDAKPVFDTRKLELINWISQLISSSFLVSKTGFASITLTISFISLSSSPDLSLIFTI